MKIQIFLDNIMRIKKDEKKQTTMIFEKMITWKNMEFIHNAK